MGLFGTDKGIHKALQELARPLVSKSMKNKQLNGFVFRLLFLRFEVWVNDFGVFDLRFGFGMPQPAQGQVLRQIEWN